VNRNYVRVGLIHMAMSENVLRNLFEKKQRYPYLPDPNSMLVDLQELNYQGGVPAIVTKNRDGKNQLLLYTFSYYLALYESSHRDGYTIAYLDSLSLREHERLSKGALWIQAQAWCLHQELKLIPQGNSNFWDAIHQAWRTFETQSQQAHAQNEQEGLTHTYERYLDTIDDLIEVTCQLEQDRNNLNAAIPYKKVEAAGEEREAPRDIYIFRLAEIPQVNEKNMLRIKEVPDLRGRVQALEGTKLTLKFEDLVDRRRIPEKGNLEPMMNRLIYQKQREAVEVLRMHEAKNVHLLRVLVDHIYQPYQPDPISQASDEDLKLLTHEQFEAFRRALTVPDILMVLGPPGTGKTRTITEIARHCGLRHRRVLITSGTHKAVDNVLERMPPDLIVIRVGHESNVSEKMRSKMIDAQAQRMQEVLLENTENQASRLSRLLSYKREIDIWVYQLTQGLTNLAGNEIHLRSLYEQRTATERRVITPFRHKFDELAAVLQELSEKMSRAQKNMNALSRKQVKAEARSHFPVLGWIFRRFLNHYISRIEREREIILDTQHKLQILQQEQADVYEAGQRTLHEDSEYQQCEQCIQHLMNDYEKTWEKALKTANTLRATIIDMVPQQPEFEPKGTATLHRYLSWYNETRMSLERKAKLLKDWREELARPTDQLYPELLRYADVVGATCIGTATAKGLEDIEFDLVIADEAGQITLFDLLVPLVRAKRAVLVGDHNQLPPFVDNGVQTWLGNLAPQIQLISNEIEEETDKREITDLLKKSAFEQMFKAEEGFRHTIRFTKQGRMPRVIADFASRHFYENQLATFSEEKMKHTVDTDPLFRYPLNIIDTSDAPLNTRWEQEQKKLESLGESGYINIAEAILIADLAEVYQKAGKEWVVIVPYRAQARRIIQELRKRKRISEHDFSLDDQVATIDSFQGGERDKVIYGFTRSNQHGRIGFLKELRRLNVAMTRAKQHLVLVGNFSTLTQANDPRFRHMMIDLQKYGEQCGELLSYTLCRRRLLDALEERRIP